MEDYSELEERLRSLRPLPLADACRARIGAGLARRRRRRRGVLACLLVAAATLLLWLAWAGAEPDVPPAPVAEDPRTPPSLRSYQQAWQESDAALFALLDQHGAQLLPRLASLPNLQDD